MVTIDAREVDAAQAHPIARRYTPDDLGWANALLARTTGRLRIRRGLVVDTAVLPGVVTVVGDTPTGLATVLRHPGELELAVVATESVDVATTARLVDAAVAAAGADCRRVFTVCSNAEFGLQKTLQLHGFRLCAVRPGAIAMTASRAAPARLITEIDGVPVRDELEFELLVR